MANALRGVSVDSGVFAGSPRESPRKRRIRCCRNSAGAGVAQLPDQRLGDLGAGQRGACGPRRVQRDAQVLAHQARAEARPGLARDDARAVLLQREAARRAGQQHVAHHGRVHALGARQRDRLGHAHHAGGHGDLVAGLDGLAGAGGAHVRHAFAEGGQHRPARVHRFGRTADHAGERARLGTGLAAADRRVQQRHAALRQPLREHARRGRGDGARVHHDAAGGQALRQPFGAEQHLLHRRVVGQAQEHEAAGAPQGGGRSLAHRTGGHQRLRRLVAPCLHVQPVSGPQQAVRHAAPHHAQADEADRHVRGRRADGSSHGRISGGCRESASVVAKGGRRPIGTRVGIDAGRA